MNNLQMNSFGVQELNAEEMVNVEGGLLFLAAIPLAKVFAAGFVAGVAIGSVVLAKILD